MLQSIVVRDRKEVVLTGIKLLGLKGRISAVLGRALSTGLISCREVAKILPDSVVTDEEKLRKVVGWLFSLFQSLGIAVVRRSVKEYLPMKKMERIDKTSFGSEYGLLSLYIKEMSKFPILTREEERELGRQVTEEHDLKARKALIEHNLRFVVSIARQHWSSDMEGMGFLDLVQQGNLGLLRAAEKFDYQRDHRLCTYAEDWIRVFIKRFIEKEKNIIKSPPNSFFVLGKISRVTKELFRIYGREPTLKEIAEKLSLSVSCVRAMVKLREMVIVSLHDSIAPDREQKWLERIRDHYSLNPEYLVMAKEEMNLRGKKISKILSHLPRCDSLRDQRFFLMRYGLDGSFERKTLEEISQEYSIGRKRVRQIIRRTWSKLYRAKVVKESEANDAWFQKELKQLYLVSELTGIEPTELLGIQLTRPKSSKQALSSSLNKQSL